MSIARSMMVVYLVALAAGAIVRAATVDEILATVDKEVILRSDVIQDLGPLLGEMRKSMAPDEFNAEADKAIREGLQKAIENKLLFREAVAAGAKIEDKDVEDRIQKFRDQYKTTDEFNRLVAETGDTMSEFRERIRKQILAISFGIAKHRQFEKDAVISESDISQYYADHKTEYARPERVKARRIFLVAKEPGDRAKAKARLQSIKDELALGTDFADLAKQHSQGPEAKDGGLMGWVSRGDLVANLDSTLFALPSGGVSDVLETEFGVLLLKVEDKQEAGTLPYDQARTEIEPVLRSKYADERMTAYVTELRKKGLVRTFL